MVTVAEHAPGDLDVKKLLTDEAVETQSNRHLMLESPQGNPVAPDIFLRFLDIKKGNPQNISFLTSSFTPENSIPSI